MATLFTREELYNLVWSAPIRILAAQYGISDVAFAKTCRNAEIPLPERGYWARKEADKTARKKSLPPRALGASMTVRMAPGPRHWWHVDPVSLDDPEPARPEFPDDMDEIVSRAQKLAGKVTVPRSLDRPHRLVARLLAEDAKRAVEYERSPYSWNKPLFADPFEQRRLRIVNALFVALEKAGAKPSLRSRDGRNLAVVVGAQHVSLSVERRGARRDYDGRVIPNTGTNAMQLGIPDRREGSGFSMSWEDSRGNPVERQLTRIAAELLVEGERQYRRSTIGHYEWVLQRRQQLRDELERKRAEEERLRRERLAKIEKDRLDGLLRQAQLYRTANDIRAFVKEIAASASEAASGSLTDLQDWVSWATKQADRLDPLRSGALLKHMAEFRPEDETEGARE